KVQFLPTPCCPGIIFVILIGLGIVGNIFVLMNYMSVFRITVKSIHLTLIHLAFTNMITLLTKLMPLIISSFGFRDLIGDIACKMVVYLGRVARGLSICTTSLLTVVQAITISPRGCRWGRLQPRSPWHLLPLFLFFWMLNSLISMNLLFHIKNINSMNTSEIIRRDNYCYFQPHNWIIRWIFIVLMVLRDAAFQGVMGWASGHMVFLLHKHHQHVLYLQTSKLLHRTPPEVKASQSVLLLMLCFLFFYWTDCFLTLHLSFSLHKGSITEITQETLTLGYSIVSPFVILLLVLCFLFFYWTDYFMSLYSTVSLENYSMALDVQNFLTLGFAILSPFVLIHRDRHVATCFHAH
uniref:Vomeronasal type-1 receptor n=1 Tax=Spermophilus dauricus TaxID=99837 RepID=A0A8C9PUK3_SPEDA